MKQQHYLASLVWYSISFGCLVAHPLAAPDQQGSEYRALAAKVQDIKLNINKVLLIGKLPGDLESEAQQVQLLASHALDPSHPGGIASFQAAASGYQHLVQRMRHEDVVLRGRSTIKLRSASHSDPATAAKMKDRLPMLEASAKRVLAHLRADTGSPHKHDREEVVDHLEAALVATGLDAAARMLRLHMALTVARDFLEKRGRELDEQEAQLHSQVEEQETIELFTMLKQREHLPMGTQMALLRRARFANNTYAQKLLRSRSEDEPLYQQLQAVLPRSVVQRLVVKNTSKTDHLAVAGSGGRVHIVSSRMKNTVKSMVDTLVAAKGKLEKLAISTSTAAAPREVMKAQKIVGELDHVLSAVARTNDLQAKLNMMDEVEQKLKQWMKMVGHSD